MYFDYSLNKKINFGAGMSYDLEKSAGTQWSVGTGYHEDCWGINLSLRQDIRPTSAGEENPISFYLQLNFAPFGTIGLDTHQLGMDNVQP